MNVVLKLAQRHNGGVGVASLMLIMVLPLIGLLPFVTNAVSAQRPPVIAHRVDTGDKLSVTVFGQPELSGEFVVDQSGDVRLPMIGDVAAAGLLPSEIEDRVARALERGYVKSPLVSIRVAEFNPVHVVGLVRQPGVYPYRQGLSVLGVIAQAGGIGMSEGRQGTLIAEALLADERVRLLEFNRAGLVAKRARLQAQDRGSETIDFSTVPLAIADADRIAQMRESEGRDFASEQEAHRRELGLLEAQISRLRSQLTAYDEQKNLQEKQRTLHRELVEDYEKLLKSGLMRKATYIETRREEARIDEQIARLATEKLGAEVTLGDIEVRIGEAKGSYRRRITNELQATDRALLELSVTLPSARRAQALRNQQIGSTSAEDAQQPTITIVRAREGSRTSIVASIETMLLPGDIVQVGTVFPAAPKLVRLPGAATTGSGGAGLASPDLGVDFERVQAAVAPAARGVPTEGR